MAKSIAEMNFKKGEVIHIFYRFQQNPEEVTSPTSFPPSNPNP